MRKRFFFTRLCRQRPVLSPQRYATRARFDFLSFEPGAHFHHGHCSREREGERNAVAKPGYRPVAKWRALKARRTPHPRGTDEGRNAYIVFHEFNF
jgi:hypothetical protein